MFSKLLIGVDGQDGGRDALALATTLAGPGAELTLAHVYPGHRYAPSAAASEMAERAGGLVERARQEAGVAAEIRTRRSPSMGRGLHELAEATDADLIVVGSSRRGSRGRVLVSDHTRDALDGAPCAVAIAPVGYCERGAGAIRTIGVAYNASPESEHALEVARALADEQGAELRALKVVQLPPYQGAVYEDERDTAIDRLLERAHAEVAALGGVRPHAAYGDCAEELAVFGATLDLLVVGSRSFGPVGRLVHGSTTRRLMHLARCPLLVLTRAARESRAAPDGSRRATVAISAKGSQS